MYNGRARKLEKREENRAKGECTRKVDFAVLCYEQQAWHAEVRRTTKGKSPVYAAVKAEWSREAWLDGSSASGGGGGHGGHAGGVDDADQHSVSSSRLRCGGGGCDSAVQTEAMQIWPAAGRGAARRECRAASLPHLHPMRCAGVRTKCT